MADEDIAGGSAAVGTSNGVMILSNGESSGSKTSGSLSGFFKRLSPKFHHRSRSKSPKGGKTGNKNKSSWVTVEIKNPDEVDGDFNSCRGRDVVVRSGTDGQLVCSSSCSTSCSVPGSPRSLSNGNDIGGSSSPSRLRSTFGNLFSSSSSSADKKSSSSPKNYRQKSSTLTFSSSSNSKDGLCHQNSSFEGVVERTRSDDELNDVVDRRNKKLGEKNFSSAKNKFDAFIAQLSSSSSKTNNFSNGENHQKNHEKFHQQHPQQSSIAFSEENLVSKSLAVSTSANPDADLNLNAPTYHQSQDSIFVDSSLSSNKRLPSYVRLSCTLSGYKNYRNVDLRSASSPTTPVRGNINILNPNLNLDNQIQVQQQLPAGKSLVERRLEKFQMMKNGDETISAKSANPATAADGNTPTPIRDIISNFNKLTLNDTTPNRPRQKPPPIPPKMPITENNHINSNNINGNVNNINKIVDNGCNNSDDIILGDVGVGNKNKDDQLVSNSYVDKRVIIVDEKQEQQGLGLVGEVEVKIGENGVSSVVGHDDEELLFSTMNGDGYRRLAAQERLRLETLLHAAEKDLNDETIPESAAEKLRIAVGKLKLLLRKKFATFEELVEKNLNPIPDDPRPTLESDLAGYYQLLKIELDDIDNCFAVVENLRANGWKSCETNEAVVNAPKVTKTTKKSTIPTSKSQQTKNNDAAAKEAARQRLKEAKAAAMERKKAAAEGE